MTAPRPICKHEPCDKPVEIDRKNGVVYYRNECPGHRKNRVRANARKRRQEGGTWLEDFEARNAERRLEDRIVASIQLRKYTADAPPGATESIQDPAAMERAIDLLRREDRLKRLLPLANGSTKDLRADLKATRAELADLRLVLGPLPSVVS